MNWSNISLSQFQQIDAVNNRKEVDELDKVLFSTCIMFGMTEYELDNGGVKKANKLINKLTKVFSSPFNPTPQKRVGKYFLNYDIPTMTFGQYVELAFFLQAPMKNAHYIMASISNGWMRKNKSSEHRKKSEYFLQQPITNIMGGLNLIIQRYTEFNNEYQDLFGLSEEVHGEGAKVKEADRFIKRYGWEFSTESIADHKRISLNEAYKLPVREGLNGLRYLKEKEAFLARLKK